MVSEQSPLINPKVNDMDTHSTQVAQATQVTQATAEEPYPRSGYAWYVVTIMMIAYTFSFIDRQILNLIIGPVREDLQITDTQISLVQGLAFAIFYTIMGLPIAVWADRGNRRSIMAYGIALWSFMTCVCGLAKSFVFLFLARMGVGVGEAALTPPGYSLLSDYFPPDKLSRAISLFTGGAFLGSGLALIVGGWVIDIVSSIGDISLPLLGEVRPWQMVFFCVGPPGLIIALLVVLTVKEPSRRGLSSADKSDVSLAELLRFMGTNRRVFMCHFFGFSAMSLMGYGILSWTPTYFIRVYGWEPGEVGTRFGLIVLIFGTIGVVGAGWVADYVRKKGYMDANMRTIMIAALILIGIGPLAYLVDDAWMALLLMIPATLLYSMPFGIAPAALQAITPNRMRAKVSALYQFVVNLVGLTLGPTSVAVFTDYIFDGDVYVGYSIALMIVLAAPITGLLLGSGLKHYRKALHRYNLITNNPN